MFDNIQEIRSLRIFSKDYDMSCKMWKESNHNDDGESNNCAIGSIDGGGSIHKRC